MADQVKGDRYLVTGGAGFIGSNIVELLLAKGRPVRVLDNFSTGRRQNLKGYERQIELIEGDIRDAAVVARAVEGCACVIHQAALPSVVRSVEDPRVSHEVNATGTLNLLIAARDAKVRRFVYASSSSVYGDSPELPKREEMVPRPFSPYAVGKLAGEAYCMVFSRLYGMSCVALRYFNVFGPRQDPNSSYAAVIPNFFKALCSGVAPLIDGDGNQSRDFTFVTNVAEANILAADAVLEGGEVINIACGEGISINGLLELLHEILGVGIEPRHGAQRPGDVRHSRADISRAARLIGYRPGIDLREGLRLSVPYYRQCAAPPAAAPAPGGRRTAGG
ncbi:MAG: SDR family oxidoreductase [Candidatus Aureabacteria bacterium]|nr:SDR family oxidoreductase [Candidatus Auribacterota bacterium]